MRATDQLTAMVQRPIAQGPVELMRLCLFDWAVCAIAGKSEPVADILAMLADQEGEASVIGGGQTTPQEAALINGAIGHALDYDDTHFDHIGHTSAVVMPAVIAVAEDHGIDMENLLAAALIGSEAAVRTGIWFGRDHYQAGFHQTATAGAFGATIAVSRLLGLGDHKVGHAIGLCATAASGLKGQFGTMGKPLNAGLAARAAVEAALWAQAGMTSDADGLAQFCAIHHGVGDDSAWDQSEPWRIARISHKFHACCHGLHAMLEAMKNIDAPVTAMTIHTHPRWMSVCNKDAPQTGLEAKFSYRMTAAMTMAGISTAAIANFDDVLADDSAICDLRDRVSVTADEALAETQTRIDVTYDDGRTEVLVHDLATPLTMADREARLQSKASAVVGAGLADKLWAAVHAKKVTPLADLLRG